MAHFISLQLFVSFSNRLQSSTVRPVLPPISTCFVKLDEVWLLPKKSLYKKLKHVGEKSG